MGLQEIRLSQASCISTYSVVHLFGNLSQYEEI